MIGVLQRQFEITIKCIEKFQSVSALANQSHSDEGLSSLRSSFFTLCVHILGSFRDLKSNWVHIAVNQRQIDGLWERYRMILENAQHALRKVSNW
jgi:hypothetical protein